MIFREILTGMDVKNCQEVIVKNKSTTIFHGLYSTIDMMLECSKLCSEAALVLNILTSLQPMLNKSTEHEKLTLI